jgi:hypothetical protein
VCVCVSVCVCECLCVFSGSLGRLIKPFLRVLQNSSAAASVPVQTIDGDKLQSYFSQLRVDIRANLFRTFRCVFDVCVCV